VRRCTGMSGVVGWWRFPTRAGLTTSRPRREKKGGSRLQPSDLITAIVCVNSCFSTKGPPLGTIDVTAVEAYCRVSTILDVVRSKHHSSADSPHWVRYVTPEEQPTIVPISKRSAYQPSRRISFCFFSRVVFLPRRLSRV
jgi:hypothetical protein